MTIDSVAEEVVASAAAFGSPCGAMVEIVPIAEELVGGYHACVSEVAGERRWLDIIEGFTLAETAEWVRRNFFVADFPCLLALNRGSVVGWCDATPIDRPTHRHIGLLGIGLRAAFRGQGLGRRLLAATLTRAQAIGLERIELQVYAANERAQRLYRDLGFVVEGVKRRGRKLDGVYDDVVMMALLFPPSA